MTTEAPETTEEAPVAKRVRYIHALSASDIRRLREYTSRGFVHVARLTQEWGVSEERILRALAPHHLKHHIK